jgi:CHAT domain-containing protein
VDYYADPGKPASGEGARRAVRPAGLRFRSLDSTPAEVAAVGGAWRADGKERRLHVLRRSEATERAVRRLSGECHYFHLATHGFFAPRALGAWLGRFAPPLSVGARPGDLFGDDLVGVSPGLLSGLALAGANRAPPAGLTAEESDDGILTAVEAAALDLRAAQLVVLSACETGLGKEAGGEGLLGLQRAFHLAGARTVVSTLWKIDDPATQALMREFYGRLWQKGQGRLDALREAQLAMIRGYRPQEGRIRVRGVGGETSIKVPPSKPGAPLPPFYWAGFVLSGAWR